MSDYIWAGVFLVSVVVVKIGYEAWREDQTEKRTAAFRRIASSLSLDFLGQTDRSYFSSISRLPLFLEAFSSHEIHERRFENVVIGKYNGMKAAMFDYAYVTVKEDWLRNFLHDPSSVDGNRKYYKYKTFPHTAVCFFDKRLDAPKFSKQSGKLLIEGKGQVVLIYVPRKVAPSKLQDFFDQCVELQSLISDSVSDL